MWCAYCSGTSEPENVHHAFRDNIFCLFLFVLDIMYSISAHLAFKCCPKFSIIFSSEILTGFF